VNVATNCGFTYTNYQQLIDLYEKYHKRGLEILAFPCNQFGEQEPGSNEEIQNFVKNFGVSFPVFSKVSNDHAA
jgi:glutathione peroxidase